MFSDLIEMMDILTDDWLMHYGMPRRSGRYPWGSGENPYQHSGDFLSRVSELRKSNFTYTDEDGKTWTGDTAIAKSMGLSTVEFRTSLKVARDERRAINQQTAKDLSEKGYNASEIGRMMGINESSVRLLLDENARAKTNEAKSTADFLKKIVDEKGMLDVGAGVEKYLGVSRTKLDEAIAMLELDGYEVYGGRVDQLTNPGKKTTLKVLCEPGTEHKEIYDTSKVHSVIDEYTSYDDGVTFKSSFQYPSSLDSSRLQICYREDGGAEKDGVIELRRGVKDLSLGQSKYAQVRIMVDGTHYLKGMAVYSDSMPDGVDVVFNTNKKKGTSLQDTLKEIKKDPDNPFGSLIKKDGQSEYLGDDGEYHLSLINKTREEGDWGEWSKKLPSQFLAKQNLSLVKSQLGLAASEKQQEYDEICSLTNPTIKRVLLKSFAEDCDGAAVHLQAASLPEQKYQVILPLTSISDTEVYAPNYKNGEKVALVRFPHGGTFEIPVLTVNNSNKEGSSVIGNNAADAIGISANVASRLSGADFDGDTVMVIPCNSSSSNVRIKSTAPLKELEGFDTKLEYGPDSVNPVRTVNKTKTYTDYKTGETKVKIVDTYEYYTRNGKEYKAMPKSAIQGQMGIISNLITDMTVQGASTDELARAVKHSMVVIDANKHHLDYKQSELDNDIVALKKKYQQHVDGDGYGGAQSILSRASGVYYVDKRVGSGRIDPETGKVVYKTEAPYTTKSGETKQRTQRSTQMAETDDAMTLVSTVRDPRELEYASYANKMKSLANQSRLEMISTGRLEYSASAAKTYSKEVSSLNAKLTKAQMNAPRERAAQLLANTIYKAKVQDNEAMTDEEQKKVKQQALTYAREVTGAHRERIDITDSEVEAIQAGAISDNKLLEILNNTDTSSVKEKFLPKSTTNALSSSQLARLKSLAASGYTNAQIAEILGISTSSVSKYLNS